MKRIIRALLAASVACIGCTHAPSEPVKPAPAVDAAPPVALDAAAGIDSGTGDEGDVGELRLPDGGSMVVPMGWDLDPADPARDYVRRYVTATKRYGDLADCVQIAKSTRADGGTRSRVEVWENPSPKCKTGTAVRDVFDVDVAADRMTLEAPAAHDPMAPWPDGSAPDQRAREVSSINSIREWKAPMAQAFELLRLSPIRIQGFGRGSYLVITLSGWHTPVSHDAGDAKLKEALKKLCDAHGGQPFAVSSAMELRTWLRASCAAGTYKWDKSPTYVATQ